ncbi:MAG: acetylxylan esterase [Armatimonadetes bacterium]|nr:acetylxylan esterase [Armatimonadota bacterium]
MSIEISGLDFRNYLHALYQNRSRQARFQGRTPEDFTAWEPEARARLLDLLGTAHLEISPLDVRTLGEEDRGSYLFRKIAYRTLPGLYVPAYLLLPKNASRPMPAVLCPHGHGWGKDHVMLEEECYHRYPHYLAEAGFCALVPDHISFGERANPDEGYRGCSFEHEALSLLGSSVIGYRMWDIQRALDVLESLPEVDKSRIGCAGLSLGGEMTLYLSACDTRVKAACIAGFLTSFKGTFLKEPHCTCGYIHGMARDFEHADIASLIAPRPLLIQSGSLDPSFLESDARKAYAEILSLYRLLGKEERVCLDIFEGGHEFHVSTALAWFQKWLS